MLGGVFAMLDTKMNVIMDDMSKMREEIKRETEFLGSVCWKIEQQLKNTPAKVQTTNLTSSMPTAIVSKFPLQNFADVLEFDGELADYEKFEGWMAHFVDQLKSKRTLTTVYSRRKYLKELLFTE